MAWWEEKLRAHHRTIFQRRLPNQMAEAESDQGDSGRIGCQDAFDNSFTIQLV
jgi:hypothetical protein